MKWLVERQIEGDAELSFREGRVPWMSWGPNLWADGTRVRSDGLMWRCEDFADDGTHPATSARQKVATLLLEFLKTDATAKPWFLRSPSRMPPAPSAAALVNAASWLAPVAPRAIVSLFGAELAGANDAATSAPLPSVLGGVTVEIDSLAAPLLYVSPGQINLIVPAAIAFSPANATCLFGATVYVCQEGCFRGRRSARGPSNRRGLKICR